MVTIGFFAWIITTLIIFLGKVEASNIWNDADYWHIINRLNVTSVATLMKNKQRGDWMLVRALDDDPENSKPLHQHTQLHKRKTKKKNPNSSNFHLFHIQTQDALFSWIPS